ncbi:MAG: hypothetical protein ACLQVI_04065 [Polyangiaceae bacterium]|jgi:hypothetical protein
MATVLGAGSALATAWFLDPAPTGPRLAAPPLDFGPPAGEPVRCELPETMALLAQITSLLEGSPAGLSLTEFRSLLSVSCERLQRAVAVGLRLKQFRRVGAHNKLRYVLNA